MNDKKFETIKAQHTCTYCNGSGKIEDHELSGTFECMRCHYCGESGVNWVEAYDAMQSWLTKANKTLQDENRILKKQIQADGRYITIEVHKRLKEYKKKYIRCPNYCPIRDDISG